MSTSRPAHAHQSHLLARRALESGLQKSWRYCKEQAWNNIARRLPTRGADMEISVAQQIIEAAVKSYRPETYKGNLLLVPASAAAS